MRGISYIYLGKRVTHHIEEAFIDDGYRILVDKDGQKYPVAWIGADGESDRVFTTHEDAEQALLEYGENHKKCGVITDYEMLS